MFKRRSTSLLVLTGLLGMFGIDQGLAYVGSTIAQYSHAAPCGKLPGFAGLLQAAHFVPSGGCEVDTRKGGCSNSRACDITDPPSGGATKGKCTDTPPARPGGLPGCACIAK